MLNNDKITIFANCSESVMELSERKDINSILLKVVPGNFASTYSTAIVTVPKNIKENKKDLIQKLINSEYILSSNLDDIVNEYNTFKE